jgi:hypothetical protein
LGHVVSAFGVSVEPEKIVVVRDWPRPTNICELQSFLGFANYFRRFIRGYFTIGAPLTELTGSKSPAFDFFQNGRVRQGMLNEIKSLLLRTVNRPVKEVKHSLIRMRNSRFAPTHLSWVQVHFCLKEDVQSLT